MTRSKATKDWTQTRRDVLKEAKWRCASCKGPANHVNYIKRGELVSACNSCLEAQGRTKRVPVTAR